MSLMQRALRAQAWVLLALGRRAAALEVFDALLRLQPDDAHAWASRAHLRVQAGEVEAALPDLRRATELAPAQAGHWFNLGYVLAQLERQDEAVAASREATQRDAKLDAAWYGLGLALLQLGRLDEAVAALKRNTELQPMSPYGWTQLARAHARAEQPNQFEGYTISADGSRKELIIEVEDHTFPWAFRKTSGFLTSRYLKMIGLRENKKQ